MLIKEYRIVLPVSFDEYQVAQLWSVAEVSRIETGGGEGVEVITNEEFNETQNKPTTPLLKGDPNFIKGQFTYKIYHLDKKLPRLLRVFLPKGAMKLEEKAWNSYPYCRTEIENQGYMKDNFRACIETMHKGDAGDTENIHQLPEDLLKERQVVFIDIANDYDSSSDYKENFDPKKFKSTKTSRGPLLNNPWWKDYDMPIMCAYKLVTCEFKWWGIQKQIEKAIQKEQKRVMTNFHRMLFCWTDKWYGLTMADIRTLEKDTQKELMKNIKSTEMRGTLEL